jgi:hypothetical protein
MTIFTRVETLSGPRPPLELVGADFRSDPHADFIEQRNRLLRQWLAWLATQPPPDVIAREIKSTVGALRGLVALEARRA